MRYIRNLEELNKNDVAIAGGKGASLGEMIQAGIPVPPGFVVLSNAFEEFYSKAEFSEGFIREVLENFKKLDAKFVAVRSSATAEDGATAAWAGQLESYLNTSEENLIDNIRKCWASLFLPRAIAYRKEKGLEDTKISVAVVIQKMVQSESAGVAFSVHPVTQEKNQVLIEAVQGFGESLVSGQITPDGYVIEKGSKKIIERITQKEQILPDTKILQLTELVLKIENHYGFPCDIEWALTSDKFYVLQCRPITTLSPSEPNGLSQFGRIEYWAEELTPPLYGITDRQQPPCRDNFLTVYKDNTATSYFINGRDDEEAKLGYEFFKRDESVEEYAKLVEGVLEKQRLLKEGRPSLMDIIEVSRAFNGVYEMTEAARLKKFEHTNDAATWEKFKKIAELRLQMRKELESILYAAADKALDELAKLNSIEKDDLFFYTYEELQELLKGGLTVSQAVVSDRKNGYVYWIKNGRSSLYTGEKFEAMFMELQRRFMPVNAKELKGRSASKGIARGPVQLILNNRKDLDAQVQNFKEGNILVTEMTRPQTLVACYKAKAIVTDEGGLVSHAAITARELNIPCVIETKIATKILKNGDMVEVDADNGIVRILSENE